MCCHQRNNRVIHGQDHDDSCHDVLYLSHAVSRVSSHSKSALCSCSIGIKESLHLHDLYQAMRSSVMQELEMQQALCFVQLLDRLHWPVLLVKLPLALLWSCMASIVKCQNECTQYESYLWCCMRDGGQYQP